MKVDIQQLLINTHFKLLGKISPQIREQLKARLRHHQHFESTRNQLIHVCRLMRIHSTSDFSWVIVLSDIYPAGSELLAHALLLLNDSLADPLPPPLILSRRPDIENYISLYSHPPGQPRCWQTDPHLFSKFTVVVSLASPMYQSLFADIVIAQKNLSKTAFLFSNATISHAKACQVAKSRLVVVVGQHESDMCLLTDETIFQPKSVVLHSQWPDLYRLRQVLKKMRESYGLSIGPRAPDVFVSNQDMLSRLSLVNSAASQLVPSITIVEPTDQPSATFRDSLEPLNLNSTESLPQVPSSDPLIEISISESSTLRDSLLDMSESRSTSDSCVYGHSAIDLLLETAVFPRLEYPFPLVEIPDETVNIDV